MPTEVAFHSGKSTTQILSCKCKMKRKKAAATPPTPSAIAENILQSMVATVKRSESDAIHSFCAALIADQYSSVKKDISCIFSSMLVIEARMDELVSDMQSIQREMANKSSIKGAVVSPIKSNVENKFNEKSNIDMVSRPLTMFNDSSDTEKVLANFMADMKVENKGMAELKDLLRQISMQLSENRVANGKRNQSSLRSSPDAVVCEPANCDREIVSKLAGVEAKIRDLEKRQRRDGTKAVINHENVKQLQTKISTLEDQILEYKQVQSGYLVPDPHLSWDTGKSITQHPSETKRDALFSQSKVGELVADNAGIKQRMEAVSMNAKRACRSLSGGLSDVQLATVELLRWTDQVHTAFGVMSEKLFFMKNICPHLKSSYVVREAMQDECTAYIDYDT